MPYTTLEQALWKRVHCDRKAVSDRPMCHYRQVLALVACTTKTAAAATEKIVFIRRVSTEKSICLDSRIVTRCSKMVFAITGLSAIDEHG